MLRLAHQLSHTVPFFANDPARMRPGGNKFLKRALLTTQKKLVCCPIVITDPVLTDSYGNDDGKFVSFEDLGDCTPTSQICFFEWKLPPVIQLVDGPAHLPDPRWEGVLLTSYPSGELRRLIMESTAKMTEAQRESFLGTFVGVGGYGSDNLYAKELLMEGDLGYVVRIEPWSMFSTDDNGLFVPCNFGMQFFLWLDTKGEVVIMSSTSPAWDFDDLEEDTAAIVNSQGGQFTWFTLQILSGLRKKTVKIREATEEEVSVDPIYARQGIPNLDFKVMEKV